MRVDSPHEFMGLGIVEGTMQGSSQSSIDGRPMSRCGFMNSILFNARV